MDGYDFYVAVGEGLYINDNFWKVCESSLGFTLEGVDSNFNNCFGVEATSIRNLKKYLENNHGVENMAL